MHQSLLNVIAWARARRNFLYFLGDIIDFGWDTLAVAEEVHNLVMRGEAAMVMGNHERKIAKWVEAMETGEKRPKLSEGNRVTTEALSALGPDARVRWLGKFRALLAHSPLIVDLDHVVLAHAGVHRTYWGDPDQEWIDRYALFGEGESQRNHYHQTFRWVEAIPAGHLVMVGHHMRFAEPRVTTNAQGGQVVYLDTDCGKGGKLSSADLRFEDGRLRLVNLNVH
jgi:hypothetical protein